jgi:hypothetical protein
MFNSIRTDAFPRWLAPSVVQLKDLRKKLDRII